MKKNLILIAVALVFATMQLSAATTLIHYWNFNSVSPKLKSARDVVSLPIPAFAANQSVSAASLIFQAIPGTASPYSTYCDSVLFTSGTGNVVNMRGTDAAGLALRLRNPSDKMQMLLNIPSTGYNNIVISYDIQRSSSSNGALTNTFWYSTDNGTTWLNSTNGGLLSKDTIQTSPNWNFKTVTITDPAANDNANLLFKILFTGGQNTGTSGNNRIDNITVEGIAIGITAAIVENQQNHEITMTPSTIKAGVVTFSEVVNAVVYNVQGKQVKAITKTANLVTSDLAKGLYIVRINGSVSKKLIIN